MKILFLVLALTLIPLPTPHPPSTLRPTATGTATATVAATPMPTATSLPTGAQQGVGRDSGWCLGPLGCITWPSFLDNLGNGLVQFLVGGANAIVDIFAGTLTAVVRVDAWAELHNFFAFLVTVGGGMAAGWVVLGALCYYRSLLPGGNPLDGAAGIGMLTRTLETALLLTGLDWGVSQMLDLAQALGQEVADYSAISAASTLRLLVDVFSAGTLSAVSILLGILGVIVYMLVVLVKLGSVATTGWLYVLAPLVIATWSLGSGLTRRWFFSFASVLLWGAAWGVWLKVSAAVFVDWSIPVVLKPFLVVAILLFGYGVPGAVDRLLGSVAVAFSGAYTVPSVLVGTASGIAGGFSIQAAQRVVGKVLGQSGVGVP